MVKTETKLLVSLTIALLVLALYSFINYKHEEKQLIAEIDQKLFLAAVTVPFVLADDFHDRATKANSISSQEDSDNIRKLSRLKKRLNIKFLYTVIPDDTGTYHFSSSSALDSELKANKEVRYFEHYSDIPDALKKHFEDDKLNLNFRKRTEEYRPFSIPIFSDRWGTYRSIFIPMRSAGGNMYAVGADMDIGYVKEVLKQNTLTNFLELLLFLIITFPIAYIYISSLKQKNKAFMEMHYLYEKQTKLSETDHLTQLNNRFKLNQEIENALLAYKNDGTVFSLVMIDIDNFKKINDNYGHQVGDVVLMQFADFLRNKIDKYHIYGRWGGEEFIIIYNNVDVNTGYEYAEKLRKLLVLEDFEDLDNPVTASFGVVSCESGLSMLDLIHQVDKALYKAKHSGKNQVITIKTVT